MFKVAAFKRPGIITEKPANSLRVLSQCFVLHHLNLKQQALLISKSSWIASQGGKDVTNDKRSGSCYLRSKCPSRTLHEDSRSAMTL